MVTGLIVMAAGALVFIPASMSRIYIIFLVGLFIQGTGLTILQTASNPYITIIGPRNTAAKRISIMGICNKTAGALAPLILAYFILSDGDAFVNRLASLSDLERIAALDELASRVISPYIVIAIVLVCLAFVIRISPLPEIERESDNKADETAFALKRNIFQFTHLWLGALALFMYVGVEVIAGDTIIRYGIALGIPIAQAKAYTTFTLLLMVIGYVLLGIVLIPKHLGIMFPKITAGVPVEFCKAQNASSRFSTKSSIGIFERDGSKQLSGIVIAVFPDVVPQQLFSI